MQTEILGIDEKSLKSAKALIENGEAVAFPTETVYGLGANAFDEAAVKGVFEIKGRPNDNPLIVHVHTGYDISTLVKDIPDYARALSKEYLPGPLTMVYKSKGNVCPAVSCGLDTVAIRIPAHKGAQEFLKYVDAPIAAPSANISKHVSPTSAAHVYNDLNGKIKLILDGGECSGGIESTVLDCTGTEPVILRSGLVTREMIAKVAGSCGVYALKKGERARSPGMKYKHYSPDCRTMLFECAEAALEEYEAELKLGVNACIMCEDAATNAMHGVKNILNLGKAEEEIASNLYGKLREGEKTYELIIAVMPEKRDGIMSGVINRLQKACGNGNE